MSDWTHIVRLAQTLSMFALCGIMIAPRAALSQRLRTPIVITAFVLSATALFIDIA